MLGIAGKQLAVGVTYGCEHQQKFQRQIQIISVSKKRT
jgi:hypothetical protein